MWKSKFCGAFVLNHRVLLHAIDATPARWRAPDALVDFHTARNPSCSSNHFLSSLSHRRCGLFVVASHNPETVSLRCDLTDRSASSFSRRVCANVANKASSLALCCAMAGAMASEPFRASLRRSSQMATCCSARSRRRNAPVTLARSYACRAASRSDGARSFSKVAFLRVWNVL